MKFSTFLLIVTICCMSVIARGQSFYFGPKGGIAVAYQQWNQSDRAPILTLNGDLFIESLDDDGRGSFYASLGYHTRGSGLRINNSLTNRVGNVQFRYNNVSLGAGVKKRIDITAIPVLYYSAGIRLEYTANTNLAETGSGLVTGGFLFEPFVRDFNYGMTVGGGMELPTWDQAIPFIEINFMPDISVQYDQFESITTTDPVTNTPITFGPKRIRNITFEITVGVKLLREVIYVN